MRFVEKHSDSSLRLRTSLERMNEEQVLNGEATEIITELGLALQASDIAHRWMGRASSLRSAALQALEYGVECHSMRCSSVKFWLSYAEANLQAWRQPGARAHRHFLYAANRGWAQVESLCRDRGEAMRADWLAEYAAVSTYEGDYASARLQLGKALETLDDSAVVERKLVVLRIAMLYQHGMHQHGEAIVLLYRLAASGSLGIFSSSELFFLLARAYEHWGQLLEVEANGFSLNIQPEQCAQEFPCGEPASPSDMRQQAAVCHKTAQRVFAKLRDVHALRLTSEHLHDHEAWLNDPVTWRWLGDKCACAGFELFAADLYEAGARRAVGQCGRNHWFRLAKLHRLCGNGRSARAALQFAHAQHSMRDAESDGQLDTLERTLDADELCSESDRFSCRGWELTWIKHLLTILPADADNCYKAATRIGSWVRGNIQRQRTQSSKDIGNGARCIDVCRQTSLKKEYCEAPSPASHISGLTGKAGFADSPRLFSTVSYRDVVVDAEVSAPSPSTILTLAPEGSAELTHLLGEKKDIARNFALLSKALEPSGDTLGNATAQQTYAKALADAPTSRLSTAVSLVHRLSSPVREKMEAERTALVSQTRDCAWSIEVTKNEKSNFSQLAVSLETQLREARKQIDELTSKLGATEAKANGALRAAQSSRSAAPAQANNSESVAPDAVAEARRETAVARARADWLLERTANLDDALLKTKCEAARLNKLLQARRRVFGEVVFARAVKASSGSHLMVRIVCQNRQGEDRSSSLAKFVIEALDVAAGQSYNLVLNLKLCSGGPRETAKQLASRLCVDGDRIIVLGMREPKNPVAQLLSVATASAVVQQSAAVAIGVLGERERQRLVLERAIGESRSVSVVARTVFNGTAQATENFVVSTRNELDAAARSHALRCASRAIEYAVGIEQALLCAGKPCGTPIQPSELELRPLAQASVACDSEPPVILPEKEPEEAGVDVEQPNELLSEKGPTEAEQQEGTNKTPHQLSLQEHDPYSPAQWSEDVAPIVEMSVCRLPPLARGTPEDETIRSLAQYKRLGYLPKSSSFDKATVKWRAALSECHVPSRAINSLCRHFRALPNDAIRCAVALEGGDIEAARAKIANDPSYVRQILAVASTLDIPALLDNNSARYTAESMPVVQPAHRATKRKRSRKGRAVAQRTAMGDLSGANVRTTRSRPDLLSEIEALLEQTSQVTDVLVQLKRAGSRKVSGQSQLPKLGHCKKSFLVQERRLTNFVSHP